MIAPEPVQKVEFTDDVKSKVQPLIGKVENLARVINAMTVVLRRRPEDEETNSIEGHPGKRIYALKPDENTGSPGVALLYHLSDERVLIWEVRIETPDGRIW